MVLREIRRFLKSSPVLSLSAVAVLALDIGASGLALALLLAFSSLTYPGMRALGYVSIAIIISLIPANAATSISPAQELKEQ